jgi:hypothetical protein
MPLLLLTSCLVLAINRTEAAEAPLFQPLSPQVADLNQYRWHNRPLVIFAPSKTDPAYVEQMAMLEKHTAELTEREVIVLSDTTPNDNGALRKQLNPKGFEVVLVGKDGGMKLRETTPLSSEVLLSTIDKMPMRQARLD